MIALPNTARPARAGDARRARRESGERRAIVLPIFLLVVTAFGLLRLLALIELWSRPPTNADPSCPDIGPPCVEAIKWSRPPINRDRS